MATPPAPVSATRLTESVDEHLQGLKSFCDRVVASNDSLRRENAKLHNQLGDALDGVEELRSQLRTKDEIIAELQGLTGRR